MPDLATAGLATAVPAVVKTVRTAERETLTKGAKILKNAKQGRAFENQVGKALEKTDQSIAREVTLKTPSGSKTRADFLSKDKATGKINITEAKSSANAPLTPGQAKSHLGIETSGAVVVGKGKPGYPPGNQIPATKVNVVRPETK